MSPPDDPLGPLRRLPRELPPPPGLEDRLVAELQRRRLVAPRAPAAPRPPWRPAFGLRLAAGLAAVFLAGLLAGRVALPGPAAGARPVDGERFLLLLYEPRPLVGATREELVEEYRAWGRKLAAQGQLVSIVKLAHLERRLVPAGEGAALRPQSAAYRGPTGYFLVVARDLAAAEALARECPHLAHGGEVAVHPVDDLRAARRIAARVRPAAPPGR